MTLFHNLAVFCETGSQVTWLHQIRADLKHGQLTPGGSLLSLLVWISQIYMTKYSVNETLFYELAKKEKQTQLQGLNVLCTC